jgi:hypothetical protein
MSLLDKFYNEDSISVDKYGGKYFQLRHFLIDILFCSYQIADSELYTIPMMPDRNNSIEYITSLPLIPSPEVFGLHANADITKNFNETQCVSDKLLIIFCP